MKTKILFKSFFFYTLASIKYANATGMDYFTEGSSSSGGDGFLSLIIFAIIIGVIVFIGGLIKDYINQHGAKKILKTGTELFVGMLLVFGMLFAFVFFLFWISP